MFSNWFDEQEIQFFHNCTLFYCHSKFYQQNITSIKKVANGANKGNCFCYSRFFSSLFLSCFCSSNFNPQAVHMKGFLFMPCEVKQTSISTQVAAGLRLSSSSLSGSFGRGFTSTHQSHQRSQQHLAPAGQKLRSSLSELAMPQDSEER